MHKSYLHFTNLFSLFLKAFISKLFLLAVRDYAHLALLRVPSGHLCAPLLHTPSFLWRRGFHWAWKIAAAHKPQSSSCLHPLSVLGLQECTGPCLASKNPVHMLEQLALQTAEASFQSPTSIWIYIFIKKFHVYIYTHPNSKRRLFSHLNIANDAFILRFVDMIGYIFDKYNLPL